jgi:hypothetical protein
MVYTRPVLAMWDLSVTDGRAASTLTTQGDRTRRHFLRARHQKTSACSTWDVEVQLTCRTPSEIRLKP